MTTVVLIVYPALKGCRRLSIKESKMAAGGRQSSKEVACQSFYVTIQDGGFKMADEEKKKKRIDSIKT